MPHAGGAAVGRAFVASQALGGFAFTFEPDGRLKFGEFAPQQGLQIRRQGSPRGLIGAEDGQAPGYRQGVDVCGDFMQPQRIARHGAGDGALGVAVGLICHDLGKAGEHGNGAKCPQKIRLGGGGHPDATTGQVSQTGDRLFAKHHLGRVNIESQGFNAVTLAHFLFKVRPKSGHGFSQAGHVGVESGQVGRAVLGVLGRQRVHQRGAKGNDAELNQTQHVATWHACTVKRHDVGAELARAQAG